MRRTPSLFVTVILPVTVRIGFSVGSGNDAAPAGFIASNTAAPKDTPIIDRSIDLKVIAVLPNVGFPGKSYCG